MAQEQNYQVNYSINVDASAGTKQVIAFGEAVGKLVQAKASLTPAVNNIKSMMDEIDRVFRTKNGKRRNFDYRLTIETGMTEEKLIRVKNLLTEIGTLSKGINLVINAGQPLDSKGIKRKPKAFTRKRRRNSGKPKSRTPPPRPCVACWMPRSRLPRLSEKSIPRLYPSAKERRWISGRMPPKAGCRKSSPCWNG